MGLCKFSHFFSNSCNFKHFVSPKKSNYMSDCNYDVYVSTKF